MRQASPDEERLRVKAEAAMRAAYPDARIIHELVIGQCRLDLAAVTPDRLHVGEIKSDRDKLDRLGAQIAAALTVADDVWLFAGAKHRAAVAHLGQRQLMDQIVKVKWGTTYARNPDYLADLGQAHIVFETEDGLDRPQWDFRPGYRPHVPHHLLWLLWKAELLDACHRYRFAADTRSTCSVMARQLADGLTGNEVRAATCTALRSRPFPRADAPL